MFCGLKKKNATCAFQYFFRIQSAFGWLNLYTVKPVLSGHRIKRTVTEVPKFISLVFFK